MLLVRVARASVDAARELDAVSLLNDVRGLVRRSVQVRRRREPDSISRRVRTRTQRAARLRGGTTNVSPDAPDVMATEARLDAFEMR